MKRLAAGFLAFAAFTLPALAQFPSEFHTAAPRCAPMLEQTGLIETGYGSEIEDIEGGCRLSAIYLAAGFPSRLRVESLEIRAPDLDIALVQGRQFEQARISLRQARISPVTSSPLQSYIIEMQTRAFDLDLDYRWNSETGDLDIAQFRAEGALIGTWDLSARLSDVPDLGLARTGAVPFDFALKELTLTFEEKNLVLAFLLPGMLNTLPYDEDPEPHIAAGKAAFGAAIETLPAASADGDTRAALLELIGRFPDLDGASGILDLQSASDSPSSNS